MVSSEVTLQSHMGCAESSVGRGIDWFTAWVFVWRCSLPVGSPWRLASLKFWEAEWTPVSHRERSPVYSFNCLELMLLHWKLALIVALYSFLRHLWFLLPSTNSLSSRPLGMKCSAIGMTCPSLWWKQLRCWWSQHNTESRCSWL